MDVAAEIRKLESLIPACMAADRALFRRRLKGLRRMGGPAAGDAASFSSAITAVSRDMTRSVERRARRQALVPALAFNDELPVARERHAILAALGAPETGAYGHGTDLPQVIVVSGDTGSGKTTVLPKIALAAGRGVDGAVVLTQPRRIAARSVAAWIAKDLGSQIGQTVGFKVRFDDRTNPNTLIRVVTDGVLLAEIEQDPLLRRYDTIILDEAHERSLNIDFLIGYLKHLLPKRPDLRLIISSATLDVERFSAHFWNAPIISVGGRMYPIETRYEPGDDTEETPLVDRTVAVVEEVVQSGPGDVLVFLGGEREITECVEALRKRPSLSGAEVLPLYARLTAAEQDRIFAAGASRRVIVSTNIAETSVTVPGIRFVVDSGVARISRWSGKNRVLRLPVEPVSQASANQRRGRCGRVGPGICVRLYSEQDFEAREPFTPPEILRANLASVILQMRALKLGDIQSFPFLEAPSPRLIAEGLETLVELGALDRHHELTPLGRAMSRLPVDPRIARMIIAAADLSCLHEALVVGAFLSIQDVRERPADQQLAADTAQLAFRDPESDFMSCLKLWRAWKSESAARGSSALRRWARSHFLSHMRLREWQELVDQLTRLTTERLNLSVPPLPDESSAPALHRAVLSGFPSHMAQRTDHGDYLTASGGRFQLFPGSVLARRSGGWVVCAEIVETARRWGRMAARVQGDWIEAVAPHLLQRTRSEPHWVRANGQVAAWERLSYGALTVIARRRVPYGPVAPVEARTIFIQAALVEGDCSLDAPFVQHNAALLARLESLEARQREHGLLADAEARYRFFDARVPADVHSLPAFQRWRERAERREPELLFMHERDLLAHEPDPELAHRFPDSLATAAGDLQLHYEHVPGDASDGVTMDVPLRALHSISEVRAEWLVPGLLEEKIEALMRSLPKRLRMRFFPLKEFAQGAVESLPFGEGVLAERLAEHLTRAAGVRIAEEDFDQSQLPPHLRLHIRVLDEQGAVLATGRELHVLRSQLAGTARKHVELELRDAFGPEWDRKGLTAFDLAALPQQLEGTLHGRRIVAYPALRDEGDSVSLTLESDPQRAEAETRLGLRRLFALAAHDAVAHHLDYLQDAPQLEEWFTQATGGTAAELWSDVALVASGLAFERGQPITRTAAEFEARLDDRSDHLWDAAHAAFEQAKLIFEPAAALRAEIATAPGSWHDSLLDIQRHLNRLIPRDVLARMTDEDMRDLPRYVRALHVRLRKLGGGGYPRDQSLQALADRWENELSRAEATLAAEGGDTQTLGAFRKLLEEYRVSLFAQEVRTPIPISAERLERAWNEQRRNSGGF